MEQRRKIAVVIPKYGLMGGAEGFAAELTERVAANPRFDCHVFAHRWVPASDLVTFHRLPRLVYPRSLEPAAFAWFAGRAIAAAGPFDLVHTHDRVFRADVYTMHGIPHRWWIRQVRQKGLSLYDRAVARVEDRLIRQGGCRRFLAVSGLAREVFLGEYPLDPGLVTVLHPGVDAALYDGLDRERCRREVRSRFGIPPDQLLILFVSMNFVVKGLDHLIRGLGRLREQDPEARAGLLVVGRGDEKAYGRLARDLGLGESVVFAGAVSRTELSQIYLAGDGYAMLSRFDTFGMVVLEAMAAGLPVLISGRVGARDLVREGENGFIVETPEDADAVAGRIGAMLEGDLRGHMGCRARQTARENSWDAVVERLLGVYESVWEERHGV